MAVNVVTPSDEQTNQDKADQESLKDSVLDVFKTSKIVKEVTEDLSPGENLRAPKKKDEDDENLEIEEKSEEEAENETKDDDDDEVVPKSKVQKRFDELTRRLKEQQREIEELRLSKAEPQDEITKQLENMTATELKAARQEVRRKILKSKDDDISLNEYMALEDKIELAIENSPKRFADKQVMEFKRTAQSIEDSGEIADIEKATPKIMEIARNIYNKYPSLQKDVKGQATALEMAVEHYKITSTLPTGDKLKESELKRQNNNLKRKVALDTKSSKGDVDSAKAGELAKKAMSGGERDRVNLYKSGALFDVKSMIPEELR